MVMLNAVVSSVDDHQFHQEGTGESGSESAGKNGSSQPAAKHTCRGEAL
jgi:hypothetical protein